MAINRETLIALSGKRLADWRTDRTDRKITGTDRKLLIGDLLITDTAIPGESKTSGKMGDSMLAFRKVER